MNALRNAVTHFNVDFGADQNRQITSVKVWNEALDGDHRPIPGSRGWEGRITPSELDRLARLIAATYVTEFAASAR